MRIATTTTCVLALCVSGFAFPTSLTAPGSISAAREKPIKRALTYSNPYPTDTDNLAKVPDADHPFIAPEPTDQRGACPGLNVLANHGFIPRDGIATLDDLKSGMRDAFNVDEALTTVLAGIAIVLTGDPTTLTVSIGGADARVGANRAVANGAQSFLGLPRGTNAHNSFESDGSMTRADYFLNNGDNHSFNGTAYAALAALAMANGDDFGLPTTREAHYERWLYSKTNNPHWYNMPPTAILAAGASSFVARCYANGTYGDGGVANAANVDPFFGAVARDDARTMFTYIPEAFPRKWLRSGNSYDLSEAVEDILAVYAPHPEMLEFGGNAGGAFVPLGLIVPTDTSGFGCFIYNSQLAYLPNQLADTSAEGVAFAIAILDGLIGPHFQENFGCPPYTRNAAYEGAFKNVTDILRAGR